jgi:two-component system response regulator CpxR
MTQVLLIDDDAEFVGMFAAYLEQEGFRVSSAHDGETGAREALSGNYAIAVLDVVLPGADGIATLRRIRAHSQIPVLMLTGHDGEEDRIAGLEFGADDYVAKPCTPRELAARIRTILRRAGASADDDVDVSFTVGKLSVLPKQRLASWDGRRLDLTSTEFNLLEVLARNAGRPVSKGELSEQALGRPLERFGRSIDVHLSSLRRKLGTLADGRSCLQTVYRLGYQLVRE